MRKIVFFLDCLWAFTLSLLGIMVMAAPFTAAQNQNTAFATPIFIILVVMLGFLLFWPGIKKLHEQFFKFKTGSYYD